MPEFYFAIGMAIWLGILTSISPCPLATNIAAISYVSKNIKSHKLMLLSALLYTIGRLVTYAVLGRGGPTNSDSVLSYKI